MEKASIEIQFVDNIDEKIKKKIDDFLYKYSGNRVFKVEGGIRKIEGISQEDPFELCLVSDNIKNDPSFKDFLSYIREFKIYDEKHDLILNELEEEFSKKLKKYKVVIKSFDATIMENTINEFAFKGYRLYNIFSASQTYISSFDEKAFGKGYNVLGGSKIYVAMVFEKVD